MTLITNQLTSIFRPKKAILLYEKADQGSVWIGQSANNYYVESYDIDPNGRPINAHPLTDKEAILLARSLYDSYAEKVAFLRPAGLLPKQVLYLNPSPDKGFVIWYSPQQKRKLFFTESLSIPGGEAFVPAMLWRADKSHLSVFALATARKPTVKTRLYLAPFFNTGSSGSVCMGTVNIEVEKSASLEQFMQAWETYYFNSYFSHAIHNGMTKGNIVELWKTQIETGAEFPVDQLQPAKLTLKQLLK